MKYNGGPERLIAQMKSMNGESNGFRIISTLKSPEKKHLVEFKPFKEFLNETSALAGLKHNGEFYFNFANTGFTGIVCFNGSHLSVHTQPSADQIDFEIFLSDKILNNINLSELLYRNTVRFFDSTVTEESYESL